MYEEKEAILHAIEAVKSSIEIFGGEDKDNHSKQALASSHRKQNLHGIALAKFHLGYLYQKYRELLGNKGTSIHIDTGLSRFFMKSPDECLSRAQNLYNQSLDHFNEVGHLKG